MIECLCEVKTCVCVCVCVCVRSEHLNMLGPGWCVSMQGGGVCPGWSIGQNWCVCVCVCV